MLKNIIIVSERDTIKFQDSVNKMLKELYLAEGDVLDIKFTTNVVDSVEEFYAMIIYGNKITNKG